jgi:hypothetical protein
LREREREKERKRKGRHKGVNEKKIFKRGYREKERLSPRAWCFKTVIYEGSKARAFFHGKFFQASCSPLKVLYSSGIQPYLQTLA